MSIREQRLIISAINGQCGITCVKLDGSLSLPARDQMIARFTNDPDCKVLLSIHGLISKCLLMVDVLL